MSRPLPGLVVFLVISTILVGLSPAELPGDGSIDEEATNDIRFGEHATTAEVEDDTDGGFTEFVLDCVFALSPFRGEGLLCDEIENPIRDLLGQSGVGRVLLTTVDGMGAFIAAVGDLMTFNVPGAPTWVRFLIGTPIVATTAYILLSLVRGAG